MPKVNSDKALRLARNLAYPEQVWWFIAAFIGFLALLHLMNKLVLWNRRSALLKYRNSQTDPESIYAVTPEASLFSRLSTAICETTSILLYRYTLSVDSRRRVNCAEIGLVSAYTIIVLTWTFVNCYSKTSGLTLDPLFYANRAGNIVTSHIPLLILLAGKNNLLSLVTGISFEKLHVLHRAVGRVSIILILVHTGGRMQLGLTQDEAAAPWLRLGFVGLAVWIISIITLVRPLRARFYNILAVMHIFISILAIISIYYHVEKANGYSAYLVPAIFFWGFDRVLRVLRVLWNNRGLPNSNKAEILSQSFIRLTFHRKMSWKAGQNAYITIPKISITPFEAHPFTIASVPRLEKDIPSELIFLIKVRNGFTKRLYQAISEARARNEEFKFSALIDGPYGSVPNLDSYSNIVIITGGSGISFGLPLLQEVIRNVKNGSSLCTSVLLIWATATSDINTFAWLLDIFDKIMKGAPVFLKIRIKIHATGGRTASITSLDRTPKDEKENNNIEGETPELDKVSTPLDNNGMTVYSGRPDIKSVLEEELALVRKDLSVNVAGPPTMIDDVRSALRLHLINPKAKLKGQPRVHLQTKAYEIA